MGTCQGYPWSEREHQMDQFPGCNRPWKRALLPCTGMSQRSPLGVRKKSIAHPAGRTREILSKALRRENTNKQSLVQALINDCSESQQTARWECLSCLRRRRFGALFHLEGQKRQFAIAFHLHCRRVTGLQIFKRTAQLFHAFDGCAIEHVNHIAFL